MPQDASGGTASAVTAIQRPQRWDRPFGGALSDAEVERVLQQPVFRDIDRARFTESMPLGEIVRNDGRIVRYAPGDLIVREGDYGDSVFLVLSGRVRVVLDHTTDAELGRRTSRGRRTVWQALRQLWANRREPEARDVAAYFQGRGDMNVRGSEDDARSYIVDVDAFLSRHDTIGLDAGEAFGEIAALTRQARTATVLAERDTEVLELRWQGLRDIRKRDPDFRAYIDGLYRERQLVRRLAEAPLLAHLDEASLDHLARHSTFETYGSFEWFAGFKQVKGRDPAEAIQHEPVIAQEGHYLDGLMLMVSGFARISESLDQGQRTVGYLARNEVFGLEEICANWRDGGDLNARRNLRALGYVDVVRIPTVLVQQIVLPTAPAGKLPGPPAAQAPADALAREQCSDMGLEQGLVDFFVDHRTINGTATMLIDTDRCTACDECVRACAEAHDGNPRFKRHGPIYENVQVTNACMHCVDPVCLIGCPTGAIHRHWSGPVVIDDATCIGCGTCANSCPYDNISMVEIRDRTGAFVVDQDSGQPIQKATKCDLCYDQLGGPACQRACPHDALIRVDMRDHETLAEWANRQ